VSRARNLHQVMAGRARARDAAHERAGRFASTGTSLGHPLTQVYVESELPLDDGSPFAIAFDR
jgi:hypothetical protein